ILGMALIYTLWQWAGLDYRIIYLIGGGLAVLTAIYIWWAFPTFEGEVKQRKSLVLRKRYWLYYALTFMAGARRQIFVVFASFLMVEKFGLSVPAMSLLYLTNMSLNMMLAPYIGRLIDRWGERRALTFEYIGLVVIFILYGLVDNAWLAMGLYIADHFLIAIAIGMRTYFQKIADPADIAPTAGVAFSINHIAAVVIPLVFGLIWLTSPSAVFWIGAAMAAVSLVLARFIPSDPRDGHETIMKPPPVRALAE
ncbi:MAG: MFS transporter, partial [Fimbriimonadaceae bacterium]|nr:MFS transporter [Alphaproteobacteria bacterium]